MVESAIAQRKRRQKRRKEREKSGQQVPKRGRRAVDTAAATIEVDVHALHMNVAAGTTLAFGIAKHLAAQVSTARATLKHHKLQLAELQYRFWVDGKGVVQQRLVDTQRLLLRTEHVKTFANLARKVYSKGGVAITCLASNGLITGNGASVAVTKELLSVVGDYVVRGRLMQLRFVMMNGQCPEVCRSEDSTAIQPLCDQLVDLARRCESVGRPLIGVNWAEVEWSTPAARTFAAALVDAKIVKFQVLTGPDPELSDMVRATVRLARQNYERQCLQRKVKPWWRDPAWMSWMISSDTKHKCMQGFGCGKKAPKMGSNKALWWDETLLPLALSV